MNSFNDSEDASFPVQALLSDDLSYMSISSEFYVVFADDLIMTVLIIGNTCSTLHDN